MEEKEITTAGNASVGAEARQPSSIDNNSIIEFTPDVKTQEDNTPLALKMQPGYLETKTMRQLYDQQFTPRSQTIKGLLYPGLYLFVGDPKIGKSFCMLQMAYKVSRGEPFLGFDVPSAAPVLYLALEDTDERLQDRLFKMFGTKIADNLFFATRAGKLGENLLDQLNTFTSDHPDTRLIIIDTLQRARNENANPFNYSADYDVMERLKTFADEKQISMILVHHMRKQESCDKADMISGTNGLFGGADGAFLIYKKALSKDELIIEVKGRDQPPFSFNIARDPVTLVFSRVHDEPGIWEDTKDELLEKVASLVSPDHPEWVGTATKIIAEIGVKKKPNTLSYYLNVRSRQLFNDYRVKYEKGRTSQERAIRLTWIPSEEKHINDEDDGDDDEIRSNGL